MPGKPKPVIHDPATVGGHGLARRKIYVSWVRDDLKRASEWVRQLREMLLPVGLDDAARPLETIVPGSLEDDIPGDIAEAELRDARRDVTDLLVVATSTYLARQIRQAGAGADAADKSSDLLWFLDTRAADQSGPPVYWLAPLEVLKLGRYKVRDVNLGELRHWHDLKQAGGRFASLEEGKALFVDDINHALDHLLGHRVEQCPKCQA